MIWKHGNGVGREILLIVGLIGNGVCWVAELGALERCDVHNWGLSLDRLFGLFLMWSWIE